MSLFVYIIGLILIIVSCLGAREKTLLEADWFWQVSFVVGFLLAAGSFVIEGIKEKSKRRKDEIKNN
jgi:cytosine/uracil/thiamine/allantoin permease